MTCDFVRDDGAYVLGSLSPSERLEFEHHLAGCEDCSRRVRELAGLPGLLAQVNLADLEDPELPPVPPSLLPRVLAQTRRAERRRTALTAAVAASVAAIAVGALAVSGVLSGGRESGGAAPAAAPSATSSPSPSSTVPTQAMVAVGPTPVRADVRVAGVSWGTRLELTCSYDSGDETSGAHEEYGTASPAGEYALVIRTKSGETEEVATWRGLPGRTMRVSAATATERSDIAEVEMRSSDGAVVLRVGV
ncbi:transmembrane anti-sigma factor [Knoellia sinensis KCTC 19936]|uniref:Transmembrane anti-sigma factor n=1 Tax=Knoellia sinensis KCTC 19936 TaxID=1385520 RepID=A0A0A0J3B9_9MICO|nr:zf-HC2 domain-containing protein [Knoellia sinensis]KGN31663.1 transmembrane anti-sigma factor [Knoellia sinensis KCTC 19936]